MLKWIFILSGLLFVLSIIIHKLYISKQKNIMIASHFLAGMALFIGLYVISGIFLSFFVSTLASKVAILLFALSPFIIGKLATYEKEKIYSLIQIFCVLISMAFVLYRG